MLAIAEATAKAIEQVGEAVRQPGGMEAVNLKVAERYVDAFSNVARRAIRSSCRRTCPDVGRAHRLGHDDRQVDQGRVSSTPDAPAAARPSRPRHSVPAPMLARSPCW